MKKTIDQLAGKPEGSFQEFIKEQNRDPRECPKCQSRKTHQRSGVGFEDTRMCRDCGHVYEVGYIAL